ncbi:hypothetical protein ACF1A9_27950 [Streptomyces sp. NPDC014872]|uniref:hypothetical protein n=1 Tax=Streptomyces sp. NPDC014872 TaxID=3364926 RepID=UPI0036F562F2
MKVLPSLSSDLWLRVSVALARLLLTWRAPLPGFGDPGPFAAFSTPARHEAQYRRWGRVLRPFGGAA